MMTKIKKAWYLLKSDPKLLFKNIALRTIAFFPLPHSPVCKSINGVLFEFDFDYAPCMKKMYLGLYEMIGIEIIKKSLKEGDTFIDVGANIGYITAIAAGCVGKFGQVHSFEPVPEYFQRLQKLAYMNKEFNIVVNQCALGEEEGTATMDVSLTNIGWNTMLPGIMNKEARKKQIEVPVIRLDRYIKERKLGNIKLIKIDTEGFEFPVLKGLEELFIDTNFRPMILCEVGVDPRLGYEKKELFDFMKRYSYLPFHIYDTNRKLDYTSLKGREDILFKRCI